MWSRVRYEEGFFKKREIVVKNPYRCIMYCPKTNPDNHRFDEHFKCLSQNGCCWECSHSIKEAYPLSHWPYKYNDIQLRGCDIHKHVLLQDPDSYCANFNKGLSRFEREEKIRAGRCCTTCAHSKESFFEYDGASNLALDGCHLHPEVGKQRNKNSYCDDYREGISIERADQNKRISKAADERLQQEKERERKLYESFGYRE